jgi:hypothetical protein
VLKSIGLLIRSDRFALQTLIPCAEIPELLSSGISASGNFARK